MPFEMGIVGPRQDVAHGLAIAVYQRGIPAVDSGWPVSGQDAPSFFHTTKPRGLGVGLSLARRVLERFGGRLDIDSTPGQGTTVQLHLKSA